jgi:hypothetical protein
VTFKLLRSNKFKLTHYQNFYEVEEGLTIYYIYVSPVTGTIFLIATWKNMAQPMPQLDVAAAGHF